MKNNMVDSFAITWKYILIHIMYNLKLFETSRRVKLNESSFFINLVQFKKKKILDFSVSLDSISYLEQISMEFPISIECFHHHITKTSKIRALDSILHRIHTTKKKWIKYSTNICLSAIDFILFFCYIFSR